MNEHRTLILTRREIVALMTPGDYREAVEAAFLASVARLYELACERGVGQSVDLGALS